MVTLAIGEFEDSIVIYFGTTRPRINAYTLASALINIADAAKAANATINPGYEIEVVVEGLTGGSFKAKVRAVYRGASNLFSKENCRAIVLGVIATFVYQNTLAPNTEVVVNVGADEVVITQGDTRIVVPREVHEATSEAAKSPRFRAGVSGALRAVEADDDVQSIGFSKDLEEPEPLIRVPRKLFALLPDTLEGGELGDRELIEITDVEILRAILERSRRRWEFVWNGMRIPAPVTDSAFYDRFFAHDITIAPGDRLRVRLKVRQRRAPDTGIYINERYEVVEVLEHVPRARQTRLPRSSGE